jgi:hypothetical protein
MINYIILTGLTVLTILTIIGIPITMAQQCALIDQYNSCINAGNERVAACGTNLPNGVPDLNYYNCQCKQLTSIELCFWYCSDSTEIQQQLPGATSNAQAWCSQAAFMQANTPSTTSTVMMPTLPPPITTVPTTAKPTTTLNNSNNSNIGNNGNSNNTNSNGTGGTQNLPSTTSSTLYYGPTTGTLNLNGGVEKRTTTSMIFISCILLIALFTA